MNTSKAQHDKDTDNESNKHKTNTFRQHSSGLSANYATFQDARETEHKDGSLSDTSNDNGCENAEMRGNAETCITNSLKRMNVSTYNNGTTNSITNGTQSNSEMLESIPILHQHNQMAASLQSKLVANKHFRENSTSDDGSYEIVKENNHKQTPQTSHRTRELNPSYRLEGQNSGCSSKVDTFRSSSCSFEGNLDDHNAGTCTNVPQGDCLAHMKYQSLDSRPIYPNVPYSPYASPYGSPHSNRRRPPLRESRRISIESKGSFLQLNQYKLLDQIGQGSYGLVKLAYSEEDSTHYAMKILSKRRLLRQAGLIRRGPKKPVTSPLDRVYREIAVLKKLDHPNVVKLIEVLDDDSNIDDSLYMVFELVKQGEVLTVPTDKPLNEQRVWSVFRDTLLGLEYLHYQRIIHADLKPGNLLLTECGRVKIADLGVCNEFIGDDATISNGSTAGTPAFRAPETLCLGKHSYCGKAADVWALGATLYALVFGNVPFLANTVPLLYERIKADAVVFPEHIAVTDDLKDCIERMLTKDPAKRITVPSLKDHKWVTCMGLYPLPTEDENCRLVQVTDEEINSVVRSLPKLDTLILIKTMLKKHSFGNPFTKSISGRAPQRGGSRLERFVRAGRSNSAPGAYNMSVDRQISCDSLLPSLAESTPSGSNKEET